MARPAQSAAASLAVPDEVALTLAQTQEQAMALREVAAWGQKLQQLAELQAAHASAACALAPLQSVCMEALSKRSPALAPAVPLISQSLAAYRRAEAALAAQQAEAVAGLAALSEVLAQHGEQCGAEARLLAQQPRCLELAVERQLLCNIQGELAQRAQRIAASRGQFGSLPPFSHALEQLKAEAAAALMQLEQQRQQQQKQQQRQHQEQQQQLEQYDAAAVAAAAPPEQSGAPTQMPPASCPVPLPREQQEARQQERQQQQQVQAQVAVQQVQAGVQPGLQPGDVQLLASSMQQLSSQLQQLQALLLGQQRQWQQQLELQAPVLHFLHQLLPVPLPPAVLLQWQQLQPPQPHQLPQAPLLQQQRQQLEQAAPTATAPAVLQEVSPVNIPRMQTQHHQPVQACALGSAVLSAAAAAAAAEAEAAAAASLPLAARTGGGAIGTATVATPLAASPGSGRAAGRAAPLAEAAERVASAPGMQHERGPAAVVPLLTLAEPLGRDAKAAATAAAVAAEGDTALHAALRGDAAPSSSSEDCAAAAAAAAVAAVLASGLAGSLQKTTAAAEGAEGEAEEGSGAGSASPMARPEQQQKLIRGLHSLQQPAAAAGGHCSAPPVFAFPHLQLPASQHLGSACTPSLPSGQPPRTGGMTRAAAAGGGDGSGEDGVGYSPAGPEGKENVTSSQNNGQERLLPPSPAAPDGAAEKPAGRKPAVAVPPVAAAAAAGQVLPESEDQSLPGTQPLGSQPQGLVDVPAPKADAPPPVHQHQHMPCQQAAGAAAVVLPAVPLAAAAVSGPQLGGSASAAQGTQGTPAPSLAALLDSQRDSTSPKARAPGSGDRPPSIAPTASAAEVADHVAAVPGGNGWQHGGAAEGAVAAMAAVAAPAQAPESKVDANHGGRSGQGSDALAPSPAAAAPGVAATAAMGAALSRPLAPSLVQPSSMGTAAAAVAAPVAVNLGAAQGPQHEQQRKRPASQEMDRWQHKRSRFGRESQEQQAQQQLSSQQQQQSQQQQWDQQQPSQDPGASNLERRADEGAAEAGAAARRAQRRDAEQQAQHGEAQAVEGSDPWSSSGIMCTQASGGDSGNQLPAQLPLHHVADAAQQDAAAVGATAAPLAMLMQLWQQQGAVSPLLALLSTPGAQSTPAGAQPWAHQPSQAQPAPAGGRPGSPWIKDSWQPAPVAGAAKGATPRFVSPSIAGDAGGGSTLGPTLVAPGAEHGSDASPLLLGNLALVGGDSPRAVAILDPAPAAATPDGNNGIWRLLQEGREGEALGQHVQEQEHHRLARSSSPHQQQR